VLEEVLILGRMNDLYALPKASDELEPSLYICVSSIRLKLASVPAAKVCLGGAGMAPKGCRQEVSSP
jgi:hypothetical protein